MNANISAEPARVKATGKPNNKNNKVVYMSRSLVPSDYKTLSKIKKQCGITIFKKHSLDYYNSLGQSINEKIEQIELLRAVDNNLNMGTVLIKNQSISVDTLQDLRKVRKLMKSDKVKNSYLMINENF